MAGKKKRKNEETKYAGYTEPLARDFASPETDKYACPEDECNTTWIRSELGEQIPVCSEHGKILMKINAE